MEPEIAPEQSGPPPVASSESLKWNQFAAIGLCLVFGPMLGIEFWQRNHALPFVGQVALPQLFLIAAGGGAIAGALGGVSRDSSLGWWIGAIVFASASDVTSCGAVVAYTVLFHRTSVLSFEITAVGISAVLLTMFVFVIIYIAVARCVKFLRK